MCLYSMEYTLVHVIARFPKLGWGLYVHRVWLKKKFQNISYHNSTNIASISIPDRLLKRGKMYLSKMVLYLFLWTLVPEKIREI